MSCGPAAFDLIVRFAKLCLSLRASDLLPALDRCIDIKGIELDAVTPSVGALGGEQGRPAP